MDFFAELKRIILLNSIQEKCQATQSLASRFKPNAEIQLNHHSNVEKIIEPGHPHHLEHVAPRQLKRRGIQSQTGRNILMHAIAHIEFNAINLALDAAYRFRDQPFSYYQDWLPRISFSQRVFNAGDHKRASQSFSSR